MSGLKRSFSDADAIALASDALDNATYHDVHCWVFVPATFAELMHALVKLELIDMGCEFITATRHGQLEFYVSMRIERDRDAAAASWADPVFL